MSVENVRSFIKRLEEDEAFRTEFMKNSVKDEADFIKYVADAGYPFTADDMAQVRAESLSDEQLEAVAGGGISQGFCLVSGVAVDIDGDGGDIDKQGVCFFIGLTN